MRIIKIAMEYQNYSPISHDFRVNMQERKEILSGFKRSYLNGLMENLSGQYQNIEKVFQIVKWTLANQSLIMIEEDGREYKDYPVGTTPCDQKGADQNKIVLNLAERENLTIRQAPYRPLENRLYFGWCVSGLTEGKRKIYKVLSYID